MKNPRRLFGGRWPTRTPPIPRRYVRWALQAIALVLVAVGITHSGKKAADQLAFQQRELEQQAAELEARAEKASASERELMQARATELRQSASTYWHASPGWLLAAGVAYALGMIPAGLFWRSCLLRLDQPAPFWLTLYAYTLGHLGKYFPGKAMVIILRLAVLAPLGVRKVATTLTIFMETLTMMAVGSAAAALCLLWLDINWKWTWLAVGLMLLTFLPTLPPLLRQVLMRTQPNVEPALMKRWLKRIDWSLLGQGWLALAATWLCYATSLACVLRACPLAQFHATDLWTLAISSLGACAMAVVLGFVSFLPGGAGVREVVLSTMLGPIVGPVAAIAAAVWLRIVWLAAEMLAALALRLAARIETRHRSP